VEGVLREQAVANARSISGAADAFMRALGTGETNAERAADRLERQAESVMGDSVAAFDSTQQGEAVPSDEELLAQSLSQFSIGLTLVAAESAASDGTRTEGLRDAIATLDRTAAAIEAGGSDESVVRGFDTHPHGERLSVHDAAFVALDEMAGTAATVTIALLSRTLKPLNEYLPGDLGNTLTKLNTDIAGRFVPWGLRAVRSGLDLLLSMVDLPAVESVRNRIEQVLDKLGQGSDSAVLTGWAIGVEDVRHTLDAAQVTEASAENDDLVARLAELATRYSSLCKLLRQIAMVVTGLAAALALLNVTWPHSLAVTTACLVLVLGAVIVLGRDYTGASDLPGRVQGVRFLVLSSNDAP
jgi:hypothetical protein